MLPSPSLWLAIDNSVKMDAPFDQADGMSWNYTGKGSMFTDHSGVAPSRNRRVPVSPATLRVKYALA